MLPSRSSVVIEELPSSSMIPKKWLLLKYHKPSFTPHVTPSPTTPVNPTPTSKNTAIVTPSSTQSHSPNATPSPSKRKFTKSSKNRIKTNVNDIEPMPLPANVNVQDPEPLPANANTNANETVESIVQELMSMNYEFDPFKDNMNAQPSVNEQERARDDINEPEETLVEGETLAEDEEDSSTKEGDSDSEDDKDYFVDEDTYLEEDHDPIPCELVVIDNDNFESGTNSKDDGIVKIRRKKLREIKKENESDDNIVKLFLAKNDKLRIGEKCLGRIPGFTLDGERPSNTKEVAPTKKTTKVKGKKDDGPSDPVGPNKKGVSLGGRGRLKSLAADECLWALQITKVKNSKTWEVRWENPDVPVKALQDELQKKYELGVSRQKDFRAKSDALNQVEGDYSQQYTMLRDYCLELRRANPVTTIKIEVERNSNTDLNTRVFKRIYIYLGTSNKGFKACGRDLLGLDGAFMKGPYPGQLLTVVGLDGNNGIYPLAYAIVEKETTCSWTWLLECFGDDLGMTRESNFTFISDRHKRCVAATTIRYFDRAMEELKEFNKEAFEWLAKIPAHNWSRSHFSGRAKSGILLNNLCECFNDRPPALSATKLLKVAMDKANKYTVGFNGGKSMRKWELTGIPCAHVIETNYNMALNGIQVALPEEWVDKCYWLATWKHAYSYTLGCLNGTITSQRSTNAAVGTRKRPSDAGTTPSTAPAKKKQATRSTNASTTPSTASSKKKQAATGSGQNRMTRAGSAAAKKQKKNRSTSI
nr:hypothetical protein [Tanacetum cinerariifolium]